MDYEKYVEMPEELESLQRQVDQVEPGPCPPEGCPPPTEIVCVKTKKVYQECKQLEPIERVEVFGLTIPAGAVDVDCIFVKPGVISCEDKKMSRCYKDECECDVGMGTVTLQEIEDRKVEITVEFFDSNGLSLGRQTGTAEINVPEKTVFLSRAGEPQLKCEVDIFLTCLLCFIENGEDDEECPTVICCINKIIVFKLLAEVQLLLPSYGFCPQPPECEEQVLGECPEAVQEWPPYPEQDENSLTCRSCGKKK